MLSRLSLRKGYMLLNRLDSSRRLSMGSRGQMPQAQVVDSRFVNVHHCILDGDPRNLQALRSMEKGMHYISTGDYAKAISVFEDKLADLKLLDRTYESFKNKGELPTATWVLRNGLGLSLMHAGKYGEADHHLQQALQMCEGLAGMGLSQDAYADVAGCMNDITINSLRGRLHDPNILLGIIKRAIYMASRAYRPNNLLLEALAHTHTQALFNIDLAAARETAKKTVAASEAYSILLSSQHGSDVAPYRLCIARGVATLAHAHSLLGDHDLAVKDAEKAHALICSTGLKGTAEEGMMLMIIAHAHCTRAVRNMARPDGEELHKSVAAYTLALKRLTKTLGRLHPIRLACQISQLSTWKLLHGPDAVEQDAVKKVLKNASRLSKALSEARGDALHMGGYASVLLQAGLALGPGLAEGNLDPSCGDEHVLGVDATSIPPWQGGEVYDGEMMRPIVMCVLPSTSGVGMEDVMESYRRMVAEGVVASEEVENRERRAAKEAKAQIRRLSPVRRSLLSQEERDVGLTPWAIINGEKPEEFKPPPKREFKGQSGVAKKGRWKGRIFAKTKAPKE